MRSYWAEVLFWPVCQACGTSHNTGLNGEGDRRHFVAAPAQAGEAGSALYAPQPHVPGLRGSTPSPSSIAVEVWTCISVGSEPRYYAKSRITDMHAKVPFQRCRFA